MDRGSVRKFGRAATSALTVVLFFGSAAVAHASCASHVPGHLRWQRKIGSSEGTLSWTAPAVAPLETGYRVWRDSALIGVARVRHAAIRVTPGTTYRFTVRVENLVTGRVSACGAVMQRTIAFYPPSKPGKLTVGSVSSSAVHLVWTAATPGDGRLVGYRVYRNGAVVGQVAHTHATVRNLYSSTAYNFYVRAVDSTGRQGPRSRMVFATTLRPPPTRGHAAAFVLTSDGQSFADLQRHYMHVGTIYPTYFNCTPTGGIRGVDDPLVTAWAEARKIAVEPRLNCQDVTAIQAILTNATVQHQIISQLVALTSAHGYAGINIDFESAPATERTAFSTFIHTLGTALHAAGKRLAVEVSAAYYNQLTGRAGFYDYRALAAAADKVVVMAWGKAWATSAPGGLDQQPWFGTVLAYVKTMPNPAKFRIGLTFYGIDWPDGGGAAHPGTPLEWYAVRHLIAQYAATPTLDPTADDPHFRYVASGVTHDVWYSNARTVGDRAALASADGFGIALWRLGREQPAIWNIPELG